MKEINTYTHFNAFPSIYVVLDIDSSACGFAKDIKIYPEFSINSLSDINPYDFMKN